MTDLPKLISWYETMKENAELAIEARQRAERELAHALAEFAVGDLLQWTTHHQPGRRVRGRVLRINGVTKCNGAYLPTYSVVLTRKDGTPRDNWAGTILVPWQLATLEKVDE